MSHKPPLTTLKETHEDNRSPVSLLYSLQERTFYFLRRAFFQIRFLRRLCTDFLETLPHNAGSSAIENTSSKFSYVSLKIIGDKNPILAICFGQRIRVNILQKRLLLDNWLNKIAMQDSSAQNSCWMMLSLFVSVIKRYSHWKIHWMTDSKHSSGATKNKDIGAKRCLRTVRQWRTACWNWATAVWYSSTWVSRPMKPITVVLWLASVTTVAVAGSLQGRLFTTDTILTLTAVLLTLTFVVEFKVRMMRVIFLSNLGFLWLSFYARIRGYIREGRTDRQIDRQQCITCLFEEGRIINRASI